MKKTILAVLISNTFAVSAWAETEFQEAQLDQVTVTGDRQGTKIQTNVVTLQEMDDSTATDLRGLLEKEPAIGFGGGNGTSQFITIRGMGQNSVDIKVDNAYSDSQILYHQGRFIIDPALKYFGTKRCRFGQRRYRCNQRRHYCSNRRRLGFARRHG